jgi:hypothetical protein
MYFSREQIYAELKRLYDVYNPNRRTFINIGRPVLDDDQVTIYTSYRWKGPDGRWILTNYYMGKYMDVLMPISDKTVDDMGGHYSKITFDPYVPKAVGETLNHIWKCVQKEDEHRDGVEGYFIDMLGNRLYVEYHYKNREEYLISFLPPDEAARKKNKTKENTHENMHTNTTA